MRILVVNYEFPPVGGGGGVASFQLARQWARDHHVECLTSHVRGLPREEVMDGVRVRRVNVLWRTDRDVAPLRSLLAYPLSGVLAGGGRWDVVNTHFAVPSGPLGAALAARARAPHVVSIHGADIYDPTRRLSPHRHAALRAAVRWVLRSAHLVVAQSRDTAANALRHYGADLRPKLRTVPLPFDLDGARPLLEGAGSHERGALGMDPNARHLIAVGRLVERKGYNRLILALEHLPGDVRLTIIGEGPLRGELDELARARGLSDRVELLGHVDEREKYRRLAACDLYVLSSHHEGFGICLQEAMAAGLPIVSTSRGGQTDLLTDGVNAALVESNEPEVLAGAIAGLLADEALRGRMAEANRRAVTRYDAPQIARCYLELFREAAGEAGCQSS